MFTDFFILGNGRYEFDGKILRVWRHEADTFDAVDRTDGIYDVAKVMRPVVI